MYKKKKKTEHGLKENIVFPSGTGLIERAASVAFVTLLRDAKEPAVITSQISKREDCTGALDRGLFFSLSRTLPGSPVFA